ncbi:MAG: DUF1848 domain-containing protein [Omnitrophica WOR_2 bacterium]
MIISASRRTDIPAFYSEWFINRIRAGYAAVPNPYYPDKVSRVSLRPDHVDAIAFSTRNPRPLFAHLDELDGRGFQYYFLITILGNPPLLDPKSPSLHAALDNFLKLSRRTGPERVIWRYDPIVFSSQTGIDYHLEQFRTIARNLSGATHHCIISFLDDYAKARPRLNTLPGKGMILYQPDEQRDAIGSLTTGLAQIASENHMEITSCAELYDLTPYGVKPGKCIDDELVERLTGKRLTYKKDPAQRKMCRCAESRDIGMYDSCLFGCLYCYATKDFSQSLQNYRQHDPRSPSLLGWFDAPETQAEAPCIQPPLFG